MDNTAQISKICKWLLVPLFGAPVQCWHLHPSPPSTWKKQEKHQEGQKTINSLCYHFWLHWRELGHPWKTWSVIGKVFKCCHIPLDWNSVGRIKIIWQLIKMTTWEYVIVFQKMRLNYLVKLALIAPDFGCNSVRISTKWGRKERRNLPIKIKVVLIKLNCCNDINPNEIGERFGGTH